MNATPKRKKNVAGFIDAQGRFRPIRSPQFIGGSRKRATAKHRRQYSKAKAGDLGPDRQALALEDPWDTDARLEREAAARKARDEARIMREIESEIYGDAETRSRGRTLMQFVRAQGGIRRTFRFGGTKSLGTAGRRSSWDAGEIDRLSFKETGKRGLTTDDGRKGKTLDKMFQAARQEGYDVADINDMMERIESEAAGGGATYSTHGSLSYNPRRKAVGTQRSAVSKKTNPGRGRAASSKSKVQSPKSKANSRKAVSTQRSAVGKKANPPYEYVLYGIRKGAEKWQEEIITTNKAKFAEAKKWAKENGFDRFREAKIDLGTPPNFGGTVRRNPQSAIRNPHSTAPAKDKGPRSKAVANPAFKVGGVAYLKWLVRGAVGDPHAKTLSSGSRVIIKAKRSGRYMVAGADGLDRWVDPEYLLRRKPNPKAVKSNPAVTAAERKRLVVFFKSIGMDGMASDVAAGGDVVKALKQSVGWMKRSPAMQAKMRQLIRMYETKANPLTAKQSRETNRLFREWKAVFDKMKLEPYGSAKRKALEKKADAIWRKVESYEKYTVNPRSKKNPDPVTTFAQAASGILSAIQINQMLKKTTKRKAKGKSQKAKTNPAVSASTHKAIAEWQSDIQGLKTAMSETVKRLKAEGVPDHRIARKIAGFHSSIRILQRSIRSAKAGRTKVNPKSKIQNPKLRRNIGGVIKRAATRKAKLSDETPAMFLMAFGVGSSTDGVYMSDGSKLGKKFRTAKEAREWARKNGVKLSNNPVVREAVSGQRSAVSKKANPRKAAGTQRSAVSKKANPKSKIRNPKSAVARRRTYEMFQGRRATTAKPFEVSRHAPARLDQLGDLVELKIANGPTLKFNGSRVKLCAARGKLWIAGKRFAKANPASAAHVINPIGEIDHVVYGTRKPHHGDHAYTHYIHKLGEDSGRRPVLCVDREGFPVISGGNYKIEARGIVD